MKKNLTTYKRIAFGIALLGSTIIGSSISAYKQFGESCSSVQDCERGLACERGVCQTIHMQSSGATVMGFDWAE